ncbi:hypothetical protein [Cupriavidus sp. TMH.W2]|uniref:hypothetical protein n=1 Tax=Cupriavidus sp. TMH.W2 TaxID=3434465 RepID=UPI003D775ABD
MNEQILAALLDGQTPSMEDFKGFVTVVEALPDNLLWQLLTTSPKLNPILQNVVTQTLQNKVARQNVDDALNAIVARIQSRQ